jgi:hypothetical protein
MINFAKVKEITMPEGKVIKMTTVSGNVLWRAASTLVYQVLYDFG